MNKYTKLNFYLIYVNKIFETYYCCGRKCV